VLNLLVAVARAIKVGEPDGTVVGALRETDGPTLARELQRLPGRGVEGVRGLLGCCGLDPEPVPIKDLVALGLLE
jgi:hypothetical protein